MRDSTVESPAFLFRFRVRYPECDAQGVVFNARYGDYADLSMTEFLRATLGGYQALVDRHLETQVVRLLIEWKGPARFDDVICAHVVCSHMGTTSFALQATFTHTDGRAIAQAEIRYVMVDGRTFTKVPVPDDLRSALIAGAPGCVIDQSGQMLKPRLG